MTTIDTVEASVYRVPLELPEADGTLTWDHTTVVVAEIHAGSLTGLGFTYGPAACASVIRELLAERVTGLDALDVPAAWIAMVDGMRNAGRRDIGAKAIAAVELGLWDLKARLLGLPLFRLLGAARESVPVYASGGFTSMSEDDLVHQLARWAHDDGFPRVKMKIGIDRGADPGRDVDRVALARKAVGPDTELFADANGAYTRKQAIRVGRSLSAEGITWFEEPVSADDLNGLSEVRDAVEADVAAGEYASDVFDFARLVPCIDVLQADVTRCGGIQGWLQACAIAASTSMQVSGHTAQSLHLHVACAAPSLRHLEYFADHELADRMLFDGVPVPRMGELRPDPERPGHGLELRRSDAEPFRQG